MIELTEAERSAEAARYRAGDILADRVFVETIELARHLFDASWSAITLIDDERHWFGPLAGLERDGPVDRADTFCNRVIQSADPMVVLDAVEHPAFCDNPYVTGAPHIRFYAGVPLADPAGARIGTLCVADHRAHTKVEERHVAQLTMLAAMTMDRLHARMLAYEALTEARELALQAAAVDDLAESVRMRSADDALHADAVAQGVRQLIVIADEIEGHVSAVASAGGIAVVEADPPAMTRGFRLIEDDFALQRAVSEAVAGDLDELVDRAKRVRGQGETLGVRSRSLANRSRRLATLAEGYLAPAGKAARLG